MFSNALDLYRGFVGSGMMVAVFLVSIIFLGIVEKNKTVRILFVYMPVIILALYFCCMNFVFSKLHIDDDIYWRILWLVPMTPAIAYASVRVLNMLNGVKKGIAAVAMALILMFSGRLVYTNVKAPVAKNIYHVPEEVVHICDAITIDGREVMAAFPAEFLIYVRQYDDTVCMPYGRQEFIDTMKEDMEAGWFFWEMNRDEVNTELVAEYAEHRACHYLIFSEKQKLSQPLEDYGYEVFDVIDHYIIYKNLTADFNV